MEYPDNHSPLGEQRNKAVECKYCGKGGLHWSDKDGQWVLLEGVYKVHRCDPTKTNTEIANDFDVVG